MRILLIIITMLSTNAFAKIKQSPEEMISIQQKLIGADKLHVLGLTGEGITVAVIDTGISPKSPFFSQVTYFKDFTGQCYYPCDGSSHGTTVAHMILQSAPNAKIVSLRALNAFGGGSMKNVLDALKWVKWNHRQYGIRVVNLSLGAKDQIFGEWNDHDRIDEVIHDLTNENIAVVVAVGNESKSVTDISPASSKDAFTVGSTFHAFSSSRDKSKLSYFSNFGVSYKPKSTHFEIPFIYRKTTRDFGQTIPKPDILAPGEMVVGYLEPQSQIYLKAKRFTVLENTEDVQLAKQIMNEIATNINPVDFAWLKALGDWREIRKHILSMSTLRLMEDENFGVVSGTSFSSPLVAGGMALLIELLPDRKVRELFAALRNTTDVPKTAIPNSSFLVGHIDFAKVLFELTKP